MKAFLVQVFGSLGLDGDIIKQGIFVKELLARAINEMEEVNF